MSSLHPALAMSDDSTTASEQPKIIGKSMASVYRKELALGKVACNGVSKDMTPEQREMRKKKLASYDASVKAAGKRTCLKKMGNAAREHRRNYRPDSQDHRQLEGRHDGDLRIVERQAELPRA